MPAFAFLRGSRRIVEDLFVAGADFLEPPLPFVPIVQLDTVNADHLGSLLLDAARIPFSEEFGCRGSQLFELCSEEFDEGRLALLKVPNRIIDAFLEMDDDAVSKVASALFREEGEELRPQPSLAEEIRTFQRLFYTARKANESVWIWSDLR